MVVMENHGVSAPPLNDAPNMLSSRRLEGAIYAGDQDTDGLETTLDLILYQNTYMS